MLVPFVAADPPAIPEHSSGLIRIFSEALAPQLCKSLVDRFEADGAPLLNQRSAGYWFTELNLSVSWPDVCQALEGLFRLIVKAYGDTTGQSRWMASPMRLEEIRIKRYRPTGQEGFDLHVDQADQRTASRQLVMFLYLNDVEEGGRTTFPQWGLAVQPKAGSVLAFPAGLPFVHGAEPPVSGPKYICGSYARFA